MGYAENTTVDSAKSRAEIERTLERYGADGFSYASMPGKAFIEFLMNDRRVRFAMELPDKAERRFTHTPGRDYPRDATAAAAEYDKAVRQKWRALALVVKAKLEAIDAGISVFEQEFLANIVLPNGQTVYENTSAGIEKAYKTGNVPSMLSLEA